MRNTALMHTAVPCFTAAIASPPKSSVIACGYVKTEGEDCEIIRIKAKRFARGLADDFRLRGYFAPYTQAGSFAQLADVELFFTQAVAAAFGFRGTLGEVIFCPRLGSSPFAAGWEKPFIMPNVECQGFLPRFATSLASGRTNFFSDTSVSGFKTPTSNK